jgi:hypothetical protein
MQSQDSYKRQGYSPDGDNHDEVEDSNTALNLKWVLGFNKDID